MEFETLDDEGEIRGTWLEYIDTAFPRINEKYAKQIVLYLSRHRDRFVPRKEIKQHLKIEMSDTEMDMKMRTLFRCDIIERERVRYRGVQDNIFDKVFRSIYSDDIDNFISNEAPDEYKELFEELMKKYKSLSGEYDRYKGAYAEFMIGECLRNQVFQNPNIFLPMLKNLPEDFQFIKYKSVWHYHSPPLLEPGFQIDILAHAPKEKYSLIWEVKNRQTNKFSVKEAHDFLRKIEELVKLEHIRKFVPVVFSSAGFFHDTIVFFSENNIAWTDDLQWMEYKERI